MSSPKNPTPLEFVQQTFDDHGRLQSSAAGYAFGLVAQSVLGDLDATAQIATQRAAQITELQGTLDARDAKIVQLEVEITRLSERLSQQVAAAAGLAERLNAASNAIAAPQECRVVTMNPLPGGRHGTPLELVAVDTSEPIDAEPDPAFATARD